MRAVKTAACVLAVAAVLPLAGQTPRFTSRVDAVRVDALVTDGNRPVRGLTARDFELRDNGVAQSVTDVSHETLPLNIIAVLDVSASVRGGPLVRLKEAMLELVAALGPEDRAAVVTFSHRMASYMRLTNDRQKLRDEIAAAKAEGNTALLDAVFAGLVLREEDQGRTLLLLFSDGRDTASWLTATEVLESARRADVVIYPVSVRPQVLGPIVALSGIKGPPYQYDLRLPRNVINNEEETRLLDAFADETGGRVFYAESDRTLQKTLASVLAEFRQRYVLAYTPSGVARDGWHTLDVKMRGRTGQVKHRRGYFAATRELADHINQDD
jgi:VWFA-related protein